MASRRSRLKAVTNLPIRRKTGQSQENEDRTIPPAVQEKHPIDVKTEKISDSKPTFPSMECHNPSTENLPSDKANVRIAITALPVPLPPQQLSLPEESKPKPSRIGRRLKPTVTLPTQRRTSTQAAVPVISSTADSEPEKYKKEAEVTCRSQKRHDIQEDTKSQGKNQLEDKATCLVDKVSDISLGNAPREMQTVVVDDDSRKQFVKDPEVDKIPRPVKKQDDILKSDVGKEDIDKEDAGKEEVGKGDAGKEGIGKRTPVKCPEIPKLAKRVRPTVSLPPPRRRGPPDVVQTSTVAISVPEPKATIAESTEQRTAQPPEPNTPEPVKTLARGRFVRPNPRVVDSLARRPSVHASSASESEEDSRRQVAKPLGPARIRNISECSLPSPAIQLTNAVSPMANKNVFVNSKKKKPKCNLQARKVAEARREFTKRYEKTKPDRSSLKMFDLIFYNPTTNPIKPSEPTNPKPLNAEGETIMEEEKVDAPPDSPHSAAAPVEEENVTRMPVPQVKIGLNGEIILDEKSLVIETTEAKRGRQDLENSVPVFEDKNCRASYYCRRARKTKDWAYSETKRFYQALNTVGTDFLLMQELFPDRSRAELKNKFKREERMNKGLVDKALANPSEYDTTRMIKEMKDKKEAEEAAAVAALKEQEKMPLERPRRSTRKTRSLFARDFIQDSEDEDSESPEKPEELAATKASKAEDHRKNELAAKILYGLYNNPTEEEFKSHKRKTTEEIPVENDAVVAKRTRKQKVEVEEAPIMYSPDVSMKSEDVVETTRGSESLQMSISDQDFFQMLAHNAENAKDSIIQVQVMEAPGGEKRVEVILDNVTSITPQDILDENVKVLADYRSVIVQNPNSRDPAENMEKSLETFTNRTDRGNLNPAENMYFKQTLETFNYEELPDTNDTHRKNLNQSDPAENMYFKQSLETFNYEELADTNETDRENANHSDPIENNMYCKIPMENFNCNEFPENIKNDKISPNHRDPMENMYVPMENVNYDESPENSRIDEETTVPVEYTIQNREENSEEHAYSMKKPTPEKVNPLRRIEELMSIEHGYAIRGTEGKKREMYEDMEEEYMVKGKKISPPEGKILFRHGYALRDGATEGRKEEMYENMEYVVEEISPPEENIEFIGYGEFEQDKYVAENENVVITQPEFVVVEEEEVVETAPDIVETVAMPVETGPKLLVYRTEETEKMYLAGLQAGSFVLMSASGASQAPQEKGFTMFMISEKAQADGSSVLASVPVMLPPELVCSISRELNCS